MKSIWLLSLLLIPSFVFAQVQTIQTSPRQVTTQATADDDLKDMPEWYQKRLKKFRGILRAQKSQDMKIAKAIQIAKSRKSPYRRDAVNFLGEVSASEALPDLILLSKDKEIREFTLFSLGELRDKRAMETFIRYLDDSNENVRGNAQLAIQKLTGESFGFHFSDPERERKKRIENLQRWWKRVAANYKPKTQTVDEKKSAEEAWSKYGLDYINDLSR